MAKDTIYVCQSCGYQTPQWLGQCTSCGEWNSFVETVVRSSKSSKKQKRKINATSPIPLNEVKAQDIKREKTGSEEFDRVLGGGFVPGQVILLSGEPGVGKSTLLTQLGKNLGDKKILYVCGEESVGQIKVRADRLNYDSKNLYVVSETYTEEILAIIENEENLDLVIVDSIQTLDSEDYSGAPGSIGQVRGGAQKLSNLTKSLNIPLILVGHVTKKGSIAGPKVLEHIVDTVLYLEGDNQHLYRILKTNKNRFGPVSEVGIYKMTEEGMEEVRNPSEIFLSARLDSSSGSCVTIVMEGFRPLLFEIQALTTRTDFGYPVRTASGFSSNRLKVLIAILEKRCGLDFSSQDVYVNVAGGFNVSEHAADLAVCLAITSSLKDVVISKEVAVFGETGLSGEIRGVSYEKKRIKEANKLGYNKVINPQNTRSVSEAINKILS